MPDDIRPKNLPNTATTVASDDFQILDGTTNGTRKISRANMRTEYASGELARVAGSTYSTIQHLQDIFHSSGRTSGGTISDAGGGNVDVAAGTGLLRATDSDTDVIYFCDWSASTGIAIPSGASRYIGIEYNSGSPQVVVKTSYSWNDNTEFELGKVTNDSGTLHITNSGHNVGDHASKMIERLRETMPFKRDVKDGGLIISETGTRNVQITAGNLWEGLTKFSLSSFDSSGADTFSTYHRDGGGGHTETASQTQWPNDKYDDGSGTLANITGNNWSKLYIYRGVDGDVYCIYGTDQYGSEAEANDAAVPTDLPEHFGDHAILLGRIVFQKNASSGDFQSAFTSTFAGSLVTDHGALAGLADDDHTQYLLADGTRALAGAMDMGGQALTNVNAPELFEADGSRVVSSSIALDGTDDYLEVSDDAKLSFTDGVNDLPFTVSGWINMADATNFTVAAKYGTSDSVKEWRFFVTGSDKLRFSTRDTSANAAYLESDTALTSYEDRWIHVACTYGGSGPSAASGSAFTANMSGGNAVLYVNGVSVAATASDNASYGGMADTTQALWVGRNTSSYANGEIRQITIHNRELSAAEIQDLFLHGQLSAADQNAGALGGVFTQDSTPSGEFTGVNATDADEAGPIGGKSDVLKLTINTASSVLHYATFSGASGTAGKRLRLKCFAYVPSANSNTDGIWVYQSTGSGKQEQSITPDTWVPLEFEFISNGNSMVVAMLDGASSNFADAGSDDVLYLADLTVTQIGTLCDFRGDDFDSTADSWPDRTGTFTATNNGASLIGGALTLPIGKGGTGATTAAAARTALDVPSNSEAALVANNLSDVTAATARTNLSVNSIDEDAEATGTKLVSPSLYFDGSSYLEVADSDKLTFSDSTNDLAFTVSAWINMTDATIFPVVAKYSTGSLVREWHLTVSSSDKLRLVTIDTSANFTIIEADAALTSYEGQWIHVAASYAGAGPSAASGAAFTSNMSGGNAALYINGQSVAAVTATDNASYTGMSNTTAPVWVGRQSSNYANGRIKSVQLFNRSLSASEIQDVFLHGSLGFSDQWGEGHGDSYTSDFTSNSVDGWTATNGAIDATSTVGGDSDNIQLTLDTSDTYHSLRLITGTGVTAGLRYRVSFEYYIPSGNNVVTGVRFQDGTTFQEPDVAGTQDAWTRKSIEYVADNDDLRVYAADGSESSIQDVAGTDTFAIRDVKVTQIGTLCDFRADSYDDSTSKLYDISDNAFVATNNGASLVGREVPVYETGTWTPTLSGSTTTDFTYAAQNGYYTRTGDTVFVRGFLQVSNLGTSAGSIKVEGLPFTSSSSGTNSSIFSTYVSNMASLVSGVIGLVGDGTTNVSLFDTAATGANSVGIGNLTATSIIRFSGTYQIQ